MSLLTTPTLRKLYEDAHREGALEQDAVALWRHILKSEFRDEHFVHDTERRPEWKDRTRSDMVVRYVGEDNEWVILLWYEAKRGSSLSELKEVQTQVLYNCRKTLETSRVNRVYALTTLGTTAKAWQLQKGDAMMVDLLPGYGYIDANSSHGHRLRSCFKRMKTDLPAAILGQTSRSNIFQPEGNYTQQGFGRSSNPTALFPQQDNAGTRHRDDSAPEMSKTSQSQSLRTGANPSASPFRFDRMTKVDAPLIDIKGNRGRVVKGPDGKRYLIAEKEWAPSSYEGRPGHVYQLGNVYTES